MRTFAALFVAVAVLASGFGTANALQLAGPGPGPRLTVVADGLNNPRGLTLSPWNTLFVAESGRGGTDFCFVTEGPEGGETCFGQTGSVAEVTLSGGLVRRVADRLPSAAAPDGSEGGGPSDVAFDEHGRLLVSMGLGAGATERAEVAAGLPYAARFGTVLIRKDPMRGGFRVLGDPAAFEETDPDGAGPDSNPNSLVSEAGRVVVADAGGNSLVRVHSDGRVEAIATFPTQMQPNPFGPGQIPAQAVPTSVVRGPDNRYYVGQLTGFPFAPGSANVYRVDPGTGAMDAYATGFTNIMDLAFGPDGSLYVLELSTGGLLSDTLGALWRLAPGGGDKGDAELLMDGLFFPGGLYVSQGGRIFMTVNSILTGAGQVVELTGV
ncbi:MAG: ScyD/ScyE family protein [Acidimicrobiales bacterium]